MTDLLAIPVITGIKPASERFAGAVNTMTCEAMMRDGKALQMGTSHELGQNFARAFDIEHLGEDGARHLCWTTSWGTSTRMLGGLIMAHGDDKGLRLPPRVAPTQVVVIVVRAGEKVDAAAAALAEDLRARGVRVKVDDRMSQSFGRRVTEWELKGVPVRVELGPRDIDAGNAVVARRDQPGKDTVDLAGLASAIPHLLDDIQASLLADAADRQQQATAEVSTIAEAIAAAQHGWARLPWDVVRDAEDELRAKTVTVRCLVRADGSLPANEDEPDLVALVGRSY